MDRLLTLPEVAEILRTSPDTLRWWRHIGGGPPSGKIGRRVVYREVDVIRWRDAQLAAGSGAPEGAVDDRSPAA